MFQWLFIAGLVLEEAIRFPHQQRHQQQRKQNEIVEDRLPRLASLLDLCAFTGLELMPVFYVCTPWLAFADYPLPRWLNCSGVVILALALWLLWQAHQDLGRQWSPTLAIQAEHTLVTRGVYRYIRHPIYAALWLMGFAQVCLLPNWIAGWAGLLCFLPFYLSRAPQEEQRLAAHFGPAYQVYREQTGRLLPRF